MNFLIVVTGRNCEPWAKACLDSIASQTLNHRMRVCVVDDASNDRTWDIVAGYAPLADVGWRFHHRPRPVGAMRNQWDAWRELAPADDDVVVWVDLDDRLAHDRVLETVERAYLDGALVTYGSYRSEPHAATCHQAAAYPVDVLTDGQGLRWHIVHTRGAGIRFNHLRTVSGRVMAHIEKADLVGPRGDFWETGADAAVMTPAIELAAERTVVLPDVLYVYTSDNPMSDWRRNTRLVQRNHHEMFARPPKPRLVDG